MAIRATGAITGAYSSMKAANSSIPEVSNIKNGLKPRNTKFDYVLLEDKRILCEIKVIKPRPVIPKTLKTQILKTFHGLDHCGARELTRRVAENYYWVDIKEDCKTYRRYCHPCQSANPSRIITPPIRNFPVPK